MTTRTITDIAQFRHRDATPAVPWVRVTNADHNGYVEYQFSLGDPAIYLEMTLPPKAFEEFCAVQRVKRLNDVEATVVDALDNQWRYGAEHED